MSSKADLLKTLGISAGSIAGSAAVGHALAGKRQEHLENKQEELSQKQTRAIVKALKQTKMSSALKTTVYEQGQYDNFGDGQTAPMNLDYVRETKNHIGVIDKKEGLTNHLPTNDWEELMSEKKSSVKQELIKKASTSFVQAGGVDASGKKSYFGDPDAKNADVTVTDKLGPGTMGTTGLHEPKQYTETKSGPKKDDPKDADKSGPLMKSSAEIGAEKLAGFAGKAIKTLAVGGAGALAGGHYVGKKRDVEKQKMLVNIKDMNKRENMMIRGQMSKKFRELNDEENKRLAKHFYEAGKSESGGRE